MAASEPTMPPPPPRRFRRFCGHWAVVGLIGVVAALAFAGTPVAQLAGKRLGPGAVTGVTLGLWSLGGLCLVVSAMLLGEYIAIDDVAIQQFHLGSPGTRVLWSDLERVILNKSRKGPRGMIEVWGRGRSIRVNPATQRLDELEAAILEQAAEAGAEVRDYRAG